MEQPFFESVFQAPAKAFSEHLENDINQRIILSGKYGTGKTSFLQKYFQQKEMPERYDVYHLFPVNYSIASNEDILGYIKYDIILEMLRKDVLFTDEKQTYIKTLPAYVVKNLDKVLAAIISMIPEIGKSVVEMYDKLKKLADEYLKYHDGKQLSKDDDLIAFLDSLEAKPHSIVENDAITKIISGAIAFRSPKKSVLIVDDLDRLDPEHVFRIFNVFAAHFDTSAFTREKNKFGFDKVVMVCDMQNIRHIFQHRYGPEADFMGYIDKFFSSDIFFFDNRSALRNIINDILSKMAYGPGDQHRSLYDKSQFIKQILDSLIENDLISIRALIKFYGKTWYLHDESIEIGPYGRTIHAYDIPVIMHIKLMVYFLGEYANAKKVITRYKQLKIPLNNADRYFGSILLFLEEKFDEKNSFSMRYQASELILSPQSDYYSQIVSVLVNHFGGYQDTEKTKLQKGDRFIPEPEMFWSAMLDLMEKLHGKKYLR